jgi:hypothetical protein
MHDLMPYPQTPEQHCLPPKPHETQDPTIRKRLRVFGLAVLVQADLSRF